LLFRISLVLVAAIVEMRRPVDRRLPATTMPAIWWWRRGIAVRFAAGGSVRCCILNNVLRGHQSDAVDALPNKQML